MKHLLILAFALLSLLPPVSRCRIEQTRTGRPVLVCPCRGVTYQCEEDRPIRVWRGRSY